MIILIQALLGLSVLLSVGFAYDMWPPWRSEEPVTAWLLFSWGCSAAAVEAVVLAASLHIDVPRSLALAVLLAHDAVLVWRMVRVRRARNQPQPESEEP